MLEAVAGRRQVALAQVRLPQQPNQAGAALVNGGPLGRTMHVELVDHLVKGAAGQQTAGLAQQIVNGGRIAGRRRQLVVRGEGGSPPGGKTRFMDATDGRGVGNPLRAAGFELILILRRPASDATVSNDATVRATVCRRGRSATPAWKKWPRRVAVMGAENTAPPEKKSGALVGRPDHDQAAVWDRDGPLDQDDMVLGVDTDDGEVAKVTRSCRSGRPCVGPSWVGRYRGCWPASRCAGQP